MLDVVGLYLTDCLKCFGL